jgi:hypothetical protein
MYIYIYYNYNHFFFSLFIPYIFRVSEFPHLSVVAFTSAEGRTNELTRRQRRSQVFWALQMRSGALPSPVFIGKTWDFGVMLWYVYIYNIYIYIYIYIYTYIHIYIYGFIGTLVGYCISYKF